MLHIIDDGKGSSYIYDDEIAEINPQDKIENLEKAVTEIAKRVGFTDIETRDLISPSVFTVKEITK